MIYYAVLDEYGQQLFPNDKRYVGYITAAISTLDYVQVDWHKLVPVPSETGHIKYAAMFVERQHVMRNLITILESTVDICTMLLIHNGLIGEDDDPGLYCD